MNTDTLTEKKVDSAAQRLTHAAVPTKQAAAKAPAESKRISINTTPHALQCKLSKVKTAKTSALSIRVDAHFQADSAYNLSFLSRHAESLNARLICLRATVRITQDHQYCLSFQGIAETKITADSVSEFLSALTDDLGTFLAYAQAQGLSLDENWLQPCVETAMSVSNPVCYKVVLRK